MSEELRVRLLGSPAAFVRNEPVSGFVSVKAQALLYYLAATGEIHRRDTLASLLWSDVPDRTAKKNLRDVLSNLRRLIDPFLIITRHEVGLNPDSLQNVDSLAFLQTLAAARDMKAPTAPVSAEALRSLVDAADLHKGDFLSGFHAPDAPLFEEWMLAEREHLRMELGHALEMLVRDCSARREYKSAIRYAKRWSALDPLQEIPQRTLMQLYAKDGDRPAAMNQYHKLEITLEKELGIEPSPETTTLFQHIRAGDVSASVPEKGELNIRGYELRELVNKGAYAAVYRAYQPMTRRDVAVKVINPQFANQPDFIRRFEFEAQLVARLEHPYIVPLYDYWREPDNAFLVMRWLPGGSLENDLKSGAWKPASAGRLLDQISAALSTAHQQDVVHRDIKPANILLDENKQAFLSDFGIAKYLDSPFEPGQHVFSDSSPEYASPEQLLHGPVTPSTDVFSLGIVLYEILVGKHPFRDEKSDSPQCNKFPGLIPPASAANPDLSVKIDQVIQRATAKDPADRYPDALSLAYAYRQAISAEAYMTLPLADFPMPDIVNPYKGLRPFEESDAEQFFGREALVQQLLARMAENGDSSRLLAVVGPSGSGKSSVVNAGLIPALRQGALPGSEHWFVAGMVPGVQPLQELQMALRQVAVNWPEGVDKQLRAGDGGLLTVGKWLLPGDDSQLMLVVDQFEELYTRAEEMDEVDHFLRLLAAAVKAEGSNIRVVITLRADFYDRPLLHRQFSRILRQETEVILPMTREELLDAVCRPAERTGVSFAPGVAEGIVGEVVQQPGTLPIMQYALTEMFDEQQDRSISWQAYEAIGGVTGALARRAEAVFEDLAQETQATARQLFLRLVSLGEVGEGATAPDTRRRVMQVELEGLAGSKAVGEGQATVDIVLEAFGSHRLLTFDRDPLTRMPTVEIAHEALLQEWPRLARWLEENRDDLRLQRRLSTTATEWHAAGQPPGLLANETRLAQYKELASADTLILTAGEAAYVAASLDAEEARQRQQQRNRNLLRGSGIGAGIAAVIALALAMLAFNARSTALREAEVNRSLVLAATAEEAMEAGEVDRALALALEAVSIADPPPEAVSKLAAVAHGRGTRAVFSGHSAAVRSGTFSPDGREVLSGSCAQVDEEESCTLGELIRWDLDSGGEDARWTAHDDWVTAVAWHPDGDRAFTGGGDGSLIIWDMANNTAVAEQQVHEGAINAIVFSPDSRMAAMASDDGTISIIDVASGAVARRFEGHDGAVLDVAFSPDGRQLVSGGADMSLFLWDGASGEVINTLAGHTRGVTGVAFVDEGTAILSGSDDQTFRKWDIVTGKELQFRQLGDSSDGMALSPDGYNIIRSSAWVIYWWDINQFDGPHQKLLGHEDQMIHDLSFSSDGQLALSAGEDGTVRVWSLGGSDIQQTQIGFPATSISSSPDGATLAISGLGSDIILWDVAANEPLQSLSYTPIPMFRPGHIYNPGAVAFSHGGRYIAGGGGGMFLNTNVGGMVVWDLASGELNCNFQEHNTVPRTVIFGPDNRILSGSMGGDDKRGDLILWDAETCTIIDLLQTKNAVSGVDFSADGKHALSSNGGTGLLTLWDLTTGEAARNYEVPGDFLLDAAFGPRDETVLASTVSGIIVQWDRETGAEIRRFVGHAGGTFAIDVSGDGRWLASSDDAGLVILWDLATGASLRRHHAHNDLAPHLTFSPDNQTVYSVSTDGTLATWHIGDPSLEGLLAWIDGNRYVRDLTCEEREQYGVEPTCSGTTTNK